ncbi:hypothetical protein [Saccharothrix hoggarensis]|uniref:Secreted protein n=1 Tax=Saccharothrix hoggarensis TaxID=913853 RepID=A0ABW3QZN9_9PSEU
MDPELARVLVSGGAGVIGALVGGGAAVFAQWLVSKRQHKLARDQWLRDRSDWLRERRADTYVGVLGQFRTIDHYHTKLIKLWDSGQDLQAEARPALDSTVTDKVNAYAPKGVRDALFAATDDDRAFTALLTAGHTKDGEPSGSPHVADTPAGKAYLKFRASHGRLADLIRRAIAGEDATAGSITP